MKNNKKEKAILVIQLLALLFVLIFGFGGYLYYYSHFSEGIILISRTLYSTIRLFGGSFDLDYDKAKELVERTTLLYYSLEIAKWVALFLTGNIIIRLIRPFLSRFIIRLRRNNWKTKNNQVLIIGNNTENKTIYKSVKKRENCILLVSKTDECNELSKQGIKSIVAKNTDASSKTETAQIYSQWVKKTLSNAIKNKKNCNIIINTQSDEINLNICREAAILINEHLSDYQSKINSSMVTDDERLKCKKHVTEVLNKLHIFVFGKRTYREIYLELQTESFGIIKYINKYQLTAFDFVFEHPLTESFNKEMQEKYIDNACVSKNFDFNVILVGFGETNQEIYNVSVSNNQFIETQPNGVPQLKKVKYHIFDKSQECADKNLNKTVFRYEDEFLETHSDNSANNEDFFSPAPSPASTKCYRLDVNSNLFYKEVKKICKSNPNSVNQIIIACSSDLENMDMAQRLVAKKAEWKADNINIFAKVRNNLSYNIYQTSNRLDYTPFGNEEDLAFNFEKILRNSFENLAIQRNLMYEYESSRKTKGSVSYKELEINTLYDWYAKIGNIKRESNIFNILSLRMKFQLLGLDFSKTKKPINSGETLENNDEYFTVYAADNLPEIDIPYSQSCKKNIYSYERLKQIEDFTKNNTRNNLSIQEHYRWNAFMICRNFIPQSKSETASGKTKNYENKLHSNLCSFEGLFEFRKFVSQNLSCTEKDADVIKYDFQLMDDAWWFLNSEGYTVFKRWN